MVVEGDISPITNKQEPRKILLFNKADWDGLGAYMQDLNLQSPECEEDVQCAWQSLTSYLREGIFQSRQQGIETIDLLSVTFRV